MSHNLDINTLFELLNQKIDKPQDFNHIISSLFKDLSVVNIEWVDGVGYIYEPTRQKHLSISRPVITAAYYGLNQSSRYLRIDGVTTSGTGFVVPRRATITALWGKSRSENGWSIELRKNDSPIALTNANVTNGFGKADLLNIDVDEGDYIQMFLNGNGVDHPIACFEFAWRRD